MEDELEQYRDPEPYELEQYRDNEPDELEQYRDPEPYVDEEAKGWSGVGKDIAMSAKEFPGEFMRMLKMAPGEIGGAAGQIRHDPVRAMQNFGQGGYNLFESMFNLSPNIINYLGKKGLADSNKLIGDYKGVPHLDVGKITGRGESKPGDALLAALVEYMGPNKVANLGVNTATGTTRKIAQRAAAHGVHAVGKNENPVKAALNVAAAETGVRALKHGVDVARSFPKGRIAKNLAITETNKVSKKFNNKYNDFKNEVSKLNADNAENVTGIKPKSIQKVINGMGEGKVAKSLKNAASEYLEKQNYETANKLRSEALRSQRTFNEMKTKGNLNDLQQKGANFAEHLVQKITKNIEHGFNKSGNPKLIDKFRKINYGYKTEAAPLIHNKYIKTYRNMVKNAEATGTGNLDLANSKLINSLAKDQNFQSSLGGKYFQPGLNYKYSNPFASILKMVGIHDVLGSVSK